MRAKRFRPGEQYKRFTIHRKSPQTDARGRTTYNANTDDGEEVGYLYGAPASISPKEAETFNQMGHQVTHKIVVEGHCIAKFEDVLKRDGNKYYVQTVKDSAGLGMFTVIYCKELNGVG